MSDEQMFSTPSPELLGSALRSLRRRRGLSQTELAERVGIHRSYLSQLENGDLSDQLKRVLDLLVALDGQLTIRFGSS